jgi:hypothetical protein
MMRTLFQRRLVPGCTLRVGLEPRDLWVGLFWDAARHIGWRRLDVYVCVVPGLVVHLQLDQPLIPTVRDIATADGFPVYPVANDEPWPN